MVVPVHDQIHIRDLRVDCVVGVYPRERGAPQPLVVDATLWLDSEPAARSERLRDTVHYGSLAHQIHFVLTSCRFRLLEAAAHALCRLLLSPPAAGERRAGIQRVRLRLTKPEALGGLAIPSLEIERSAEALDLVQEHKPFGTVDVVFETTNAGIYRLNIAPGKGIPLHMHKIMRESEMVLTSGLLCQDERVPVGTVHRWPLGAKHRYDNPTGRYQTILCVDSPRFIEGDEILTEGEPTHVPAEPALGSDGESGGAPDRRMRP